MPSLLDDYKIVTQNNESPPIYHLFSGLVALSALVSGKVWLDLGLFSIRPNIYVILTGSPGVKKTTAMAVAKRLLREIGDSIPLSAECQTKESLTLSMASKARPCTLTPGKVPKRFEPLDQENSKFLYCPMTVCVTELSQFVGGSNAAHMLDFLTTIYDEESYKNETKGKGVDILPMPYLTLLGCTVPDWITAKLKEDVITGGFSRRAIFVYSDHTDQRVPIPFVTPEMDQAWHRVVVRARKISELKGPFDWGKGAQDFYCKWYINLRRPDDPLLDGWFNSVHIQMLKLAMLISASEWEGGQHFIEIHHMEASLGLLDLIEKNIPRVFKGVGRNELFGISNKVLEMLRLAPGKALPERLVKKDLFREANIDEITKIVQHLVQSGQVTRELREHPVSHVRELFLVTQ